METRTLGQSGVAVSVLGLGTWPMGGEWWGGTDDAESIRAFGADVVAGICRRLLDGGAPGLHFYTLNLAKPTLNVLERLA